LNSGPSRAFRCLLTCRRVRRRSTPSEFSVPSTVSPGRAPYETAVTPPRCRSRVFSTPQRFPGKSELRGLVSCRYRSWDPPFRAFPSSRSLTPLGAAWLPCSHPPACKDARPDTVSPLVSPTPTQARPPGSPNDYELPLIEPKPASRSPWVSCHGTASSRQLHLLRSVSPSPSPFTDTASFPPAPGRCSLGFRPL